MPQISPESPFRNEHYNHKGVLKKKLYERELRELQVELGKLQRHVAQQGLRVVVLFEGRDAAGKGGVIKRHARRNCIADLLQQFEYPTGPIPAPELPPRQCDDLYERDSRYLDAYIQPRY